MPSVETSNTFQNPDAVNPLVSRPLKNDGETKPVAVDLGDSLAEVIQNFYKVVFYRS